MNTITLSLLALTGLGPIIVATYPATPWPQDPAGQKKPAKEVIEPEDAKTVWEYLSGRYDTNGDGKIARDEYSRGTSQFERLDKDKNGFIEEADTKARGRRPGGPGRGGERRNVEAPTEGSVAPDFELETLYPTKAKDAETKEKTPGAEPKSTSEEPVTYERVKLSAWKGKKPVALIFGSYT